MHIDSRDHLPQRGKLFGVLARTADLSGVNTLWLRIGALAMLCLAFKLTLLAYCVAAITFRLARD